MADFVTTTRIYATPNEVAYKYAAYIQLTQDREVNKEQAFNELILMGAQSALPREVAKGLELDKALVALREEQSESAPKKSGAK